MLTYSNIPSLLYMPNESAMSKWSSMCPITFLAHLLHKFQTFSSITSILYNRTYNFKIILLTLAILVVQREGTFHRLQCMCRLINSWANSLLNTGYLELKYGN